MKPGRTTKCEQIFITEDLYKDTGCSIATLYLRLQDVETNSRCQECPFPICIEELSPRDKKILKKHQLIKQILAEYNKDKSITIIAHKHNLSYSYVNRCIEDKHNINKLLADWAEFINSQDKLKSLSLV